MPFNKDIKKVFVIGSGPIVIGQAAEFDYAGTQACMALKEQGIEVVLLNNNPATIMTDEQMADRIYIEPITIETVEKILQIERPDGIIGTLGGQTGLNLTVQLHQHKILEKYHVQLLGTSVEAIQKGEDREQFRNLMMEIQEPISESKIVDSIEEGLSFVKEVEYPLIVRPAYTLGGAGGGFAENDEELKSILTSGLSLSPIHQVLVERSIKGWKEIEYEVIRDDNDTCIIVCNMENLDPVGVHTGDSIVVAPSQTLSDVQYQILRNASLKVIRALGVIGGCNIQFALDPNSNQYYIIEVNPRVSRSSALASKATGYPIARIATLCALGYHLDEIFNPITGNTFASFEPALDYVVVKLPRFPFDKFPDANRQLGTQMKATGETMAIDRSFEGALNKGLRSLEYKAYGLSHPLIKTQSSLELQQHMEEATDLRLFAIAEAIRRGIALDTIQGMTQIDRWFLAKINGMIALEAIIQPYSISELPYALFKQAKKWQLSDRYIGELTGCSEKQVREQRKALGLSPVFKQVDTCAGEFEAETPYYYSTWQGTDEVENSDRKKAMVLGSGPIRIGQGIEFDYCCVHAVLALKKQGYETIVVNNNPETVSTDYSIADKLYFEPLTIEDILPIIQKEKPEGVFIQFGGQTAIQLAVELHKEGIKLFGTKLETIDILEDRQQFYQLLDRLNIPHIKGEVAHSLADLKTIANQLGYPVLVRPSYVIGGQSMLVLYNDDEIDQYIYQKHSMHDCSWPLLIDQYIPGLECELDGISDGERIFIPGIFEHIERAGVHSGDSLSFYPPQTLSALQKKQIITYTEKICREVGIIGVLNIQFVIHEDRIYCLEVNPRASRTVPILSKVTGIPIIDLAVAVQLGAVLKKAGLAEEPTFTAVKSSIFSFNKLDHVDPVLGPEMKSTGEILGLGLTWKHALKKALMYQQPDKGSSSQPWTIFCSISNREKEAWLSIQKDEWAAANLNLLATKGTAQFLQQHDVDVVFVEKDKTSLEQLFKEQGFAGAVIIPTYGNEKKKLGSLMRELSLRYHIPLFTSVDTFRAFMESLHVKEETILSLDAYRSETSISEGVPSSPSD